MRNDYRGDCLPVGAGLAGEPDGIVTALSPRLIGGYRFFRQRVARQPTQEKTVSKAGLEPARSQDFSRLKCITVDGAPFGPAGYEYVYTKIKADVQLASPAGGTNPLGALVTGNPISPVWPGEIQCRGLGLKMEVFSEVAKPLVGEPGELVCTMPFVQLTSG